MNGPAKSYKPSSWCLFKYSESAVISELAQIMAVPLLAEEVVMIPFSIYHILRLVDGQSRGIHSDVSRWMTTSSWSLQIWYEFPEDRPRTRRSSDIKQDIPFDSQHNISRTSRGVFKVESSSRLERGMVGLYVPRPCIFGVKNGSVVFRFHFWSPTWAQSVAVAVVILQQNGPWDGIMLIAMELLQSLGKKPLISSRPYWVD